MGIMNNLKSKDYKRILYVKVGATFYGEVFKGELNSHNKAKGIFKKLDDETMLLMLNNSTDRGWFLDMSESWYGDDWEIANFQLVDLDITINPFV